MNRAVFFDRDGVINPLVYNLYTQAYESPNFPYEFSVYPFAARAMQTLSDAGFDLYVISNQPSCAKGKTSMENLQIIAGMLRAYLLEQGVSIQEYLYCYHHPQGVVPEYTCICDCRKPKTGLLEQAMAKRPFDRKESWFVGDQDTDILCGKRFGLRTISIENPHSASKRGGETPDFCANDIWDAVEIIRKEATIAC